LSAETLGDTTKFNFAHLSKFLRYPEIDLLSVQPRLDGEKCVSGQPGILVAHSGNVSLDKTFGWIKSFGTTLA
jgi:hypothetical protein